MHGHIVPLSLAAAVAVGTGCTVEDDAAVGAVDQPITDGLASEADEAVGAMLVRERQSCSCTLIDPMVALTAAHCLPPHTPVSVEDLRVFFGQNTAFEGEHIAVLDAVPHPLWQPDLLGYDIGLVRLAQPVDIEPARPASPPLPDELIGHHARIVGFGVNHKDGLVHEFRRSGTATIDDVSPFSVRLVPSESLPCTGDSGGPMMLERDGVELVAAVHSRSDCETRAIEERVDIHMQSFVEPFIEASRLCGTSRVCYMPCRAESCEIECDRLGLCAPARADDDVDVGCTVGGGSSGDPLALALVLLVLAMASSRR